MARPNQSWYKAMNRLWISNKLDEYTFLKIKYKHEYESFVNYCCKVYELYGWQGIDALVEEYDSGTYFGIRRVRMYHTNVKKWYSIMHTVFKRDNYTCSYCGVQGGKLEVDHIIPFSKGGTDNLNNLTTSCRHCNRQKRDKSKKEFLKWRGKNAD